MGPYKDVADRLFSYMRDIIYMPDEAYLDLSELPEDFLEVGKGLVYLHSAVSEARKFSVQLAEGNLNCEVPPPDNAIAAPLKSLHATLKHLTWQTQMVSKGKYNQKVTFMGEFSKAFNEMISQLRHRDEENTDEKIRLKSHLVKINHEIRTPMNAILGMSELLMGEPMSDTALSYVKNINRAGANLLNIINDVLDFSKIESGRLELLEDDYALDELLGDVINIIQIKAQIAGLVFNTEIDRDLPSRIYGDASRLHQILLNILGNAVKYTDQGFVSLSVTGEAVDDEINLVFMVADSGRGIEEVNIATLFDEFARFDLYANRGIEGTGLGLPIARGLARAMGGDITVESKYGEGSTFAIKVPQKIRSNGKISGSRLSAGDGVLYASFTAPQARVLVVDDVEMNLMVADGMLEPYKMKVDLCSGGKKALKAIMESDSYDLILLDHMMPDMDGMEVTARVRAGGGDYLCNLPIVALTANAVPGAKEIYLAFGFNDFLAKPLSVSAMGAVLEKWIPKEKRVLI